ncbi:prepilin-type N-terminal cleavage/methylation domain-containing protein [Deinococcus yunweiensis]|uniref:prepilin-type N-terminal cleavage/methylation domain-containing protein n=1 Tax=Deinococcus yunweiensis TaxID=367282 RepID=UPI00398EF179
MNPFAPHISHFWQAGFTLIELLIAIAIIAILAIVLIPNVLNARAQAYNQSASTYARQIGMWATSWLTEQPTRRASDLNSDCTSAMYVQQGASGTLPQWVSECVVATPGDGTFTVTVTMHTGKTFTYKQ